MYLKRLDLQGFKSFPDKANFIFNKGITAIVGPNGSGKSNISDSIKWVLGEQKVKSLRGDKMEDIIFSGTEYRKPRGFAEVSITIDNTNNELPIEYTDVTITRRIYRSGESEYLINDSICRLKDIYELFMDTGIGKEGYSIIGQGKIDDILNTKSDTRRRIFEEATGIIKFKNRRNETFLKLEKERQNLSRVEDIIYELEKQIEPLEKQSKIAEKYIMLKEKVKIYEISLFKYNRNMINTELSNVNNKLNFFYNDIKEKEKEKISINENIILYKNDFVLCDEEIQSLNNNIIIKNRFIEKSESIIKVNKEKINHLYSNIDKICIDRENTLKLIENNKNYINIEQSKIDANKIQFKLYNETLKEHEYEFEKLNSIINKNKSVIDEYKSNILEKVRKSTEFKGEISRLESLKEEYFKRQEQINREKNYIENEINEINIHIKSLEEKKKLNINELSKLKNRLDCYEIKKSDFLKNINNLKSIFTIKEKDFNEKKSRLSILLDMKNHYEGFYKSVKSILKLKNNINFSGIRGVVGEIFDVDKIYELAIETALGSSLQNIITDTEDDAKLAIEYLKENNLGRATFLPISAIKGKAIDSIEKNKFLDEYGVLGIASDIVKYDNIYDNIAIFLLGRVVITKDIDSAIKFSKKYKYYYKVVTLGGDIINLGGSITGGSNSKKVSNIFGRNREIKELDKDINDINFELLNLSKNIKSCENDMNNLNNDIYDINIKIKEINVNNQNIVDEILKTMNSLSDKSKKLDIYLIEEKQLYEQLDITKNDLYNYEFKFKNINNDINVINSDLSKYEINIENEELSKNELFEKITNIKMNINNIEQSNIVSKNNIERFNELMNQFKKDLYLFSENEDKYEMDIEFNKKEIAKVEQNIIELKNELLEIQHNIEENITKRNKLKENIDILEIKMREISDEIFKIKNDIIKYESKNEKLFEDMDRIILNIKNEYDLDIDQIENIDKIDDNSVDYIKKNLYTLKSNIKDLGNININSIEEYKNVKKRYDFLLEQKNDIQEAEEKLNSIILELTSLMEKQFKEQFEIISKNFSDTFNEIFGGGKAYLKLNDESDILNCSIDIVAQPPGKKLQNMMLLSGGERALTAISILFSILKMKPSPFCILDEIEAALDDVNVKRYADYLKNFSKDTQFIIITHRKGSMEVADTMYGVTMQEKGVSKLVSVSFIDN